MHSTILLQNAVRPPISAAAASLPETMHSEQSSLEKQRQVLQTKQRGYQWKSEFQ